MSSPHTTRADEDAMLLSVLEALLAADWNPTWEPDEDASTPMPHQAAQTDIREMELPFWRTHLVLNQQGVAEAQIEIDDDAEQSALELLRRNFGPGIEIAQMHRRIHRWLVNGREVLLDSFNGRATCLRIA